MTPFRIISSANTAYTAASAASAAFGTTTLAIRLLATTDCHIRFAAAPVAVSTDLFLKAGVAEYYKVVPGEKVAAIRDAADGYLNVVELTK